MQAVPVFEIAAVPREVNMMWIRMRRIVRQLLRAQLEALPRDQGHLLRCPWMKDLVPLGWCIQMVDGERGISIQKIDAEALREKIPWFCKIRLLHEGPYVACYAVSEQGKIWGRMRFYETQLQFMDRMCVYDGRIKYFVKVISWWSRSAQIVAYKFPAGAPSVIAKSIAAEAVNGERETARQLAETLAAQVARGEQEAMRALAET